MSHEDAAEHFDGAVPDGYEQFMVPLMFQPYADDLVRRVVARHPASVLELAAGTGVVTRGLAAALPASCRIVATDLNGAMIDVARRRGAERAPGAENIEWGIADAQSLPFDDASFDLAVCQFGVMFFPDRVESHREVRRVLVPGGTYLLTAWDSVAHNAVAAAVEAAYREVVPDGPPSMVTQVAHGYHDPERIRSDLEAGGLIVECAGGVYRPRPLAGEHAFEVIASNGPLHRPLEDQLKQPLR